MKNITNSLLNKTQKERVKKVKETLQQKKPFSNHWAYAPLKPEGKPIEYDRVDKDE